MEIILNNSQLKAFTRLDQRNIKVGSYNTHKDVFIPDVNEIQNQISKNIRLGNLFFADEIVKDCQTLLIPVLEQGVKI